MRLPLLRLITQQQNALFKRKKRHSFAYRGQQEQRAIHHCRMFVTLLPRSRRQPRRLFCATQEQMVSNDTHSLRVLFTILVIQNTYVPFFLLYLFIRCICFIFLQKYRKRERKTFIPEILIDKVYVRYQVTRSLKRKNWVPVLSI